MTVELDALTCLRSYRSITMDRLARAVGCSRREAEAAIETLRLEGQPIVADTFGLRLTNDPDELRAYIEARRRRLVTIYKGNRALRRAEKALRERTDLTLFGTAA